MCKGLKFLWWSIGEAEVQIQGQEQGEAREAYVQFQGTPHNPVTKTNTNSRPHDLKTIFFKTSEKPG